MQITGSKIGNTQTDWIGETPGTDETRTIADALSTSSLRFLDLAIIGFVASALATMAGFAFAGWSTHGAAILMDFATGGLSWCL